MPHDNVRGLIKSRHPLWQETKDKWDFVEAHYDGQLLLDDVRNGHRSRFLHKKSQSETWEEFQERKKVSPYTNYLAPVLDSLVGLLMNKEAEAERDWGALGDPDSPTSVASRIKRDADGKETDHDAKIKQLTTDILQFQRIGVLVDTNRPSETVNLTRLEAQAAGVRPFWEIIRPQDILNWRAADGGHLVEALIREHRDSRQHLGDPDGEARQEAFLWLTTEGFVRYVKGSGGKFIAVDVGRYDYRTRTGQPTIPFNVARLPLRRYPAYDLADLNNQIFNHESATIYWPLRKAGFARFIYDGSNSDFEEFKDDARSHGANLINEGEDSGGNSRYVAPPTNVADSGMQAREELIKAFFRSATFEFSDQAAERTATEINAEFLATIGSSLETLAGAIDEAETQLMFLLEQAAEGPQSGGDAFVRRTRDFTVQDSLSVAKEWKNLIAGNNDPLPVNDEIRERMTQRILQQIGLDIEEDDVLPESEPQNEEDS